MHLWQGYPPSGNFLKGHSSKDISIKSPKHDSNAEESVDPGSDKKVDPELDPKAEENLEEADTKSVEVGGVEEFSKEVNGKEALSPDTVLVVV